MGDVPQDDESLLVERGLDTEGHTSDFGAGFNNGLETCLVTKLLNTTGSTSVSVDAANWNKLSARDSTQKK